MACQILCVIYDCMNNQRTEYLIAPDFLGEDLNFLIKPNENVQKFPAISSKLKNIQKLSLSSKGFSVSYSGQQFNRSVDINSNIYQ